MSAIASFWSPPRTNNLLTMNPLPPSSDIRSATVLATVATDGFAPGTVTMIRSVLRHNPWFDGRIAVFFASTFAPLRERAFDDIRRSADPHVVDFHDVDIEAYRPANIQSIRRKWRPAILALESFRLQGADKVVCIDSDILCLGDIHELFDNDWAFAIAPHGKFSNAGASPTQLSPCDPKPGFNSGVFVVGKALLNQASFTGIVGQAIGNGTDTADQVRVDRYFADKPVTLLSTAFNQNYKIFRRISSRRILQERLKHVRLLHFLGSRKPWRQAPRRGDRLLFDLWREAPR